MTRLAALVKVQVVLGLAAYAYLPFRPELDFGSIWSFLSACALYLGKIALLAAVCGLGRAALGREGPPTAGHLLLLASAIAVLGLASGAILHA